MKNLNLPPEAELLSVIEKEQKLEWRNYQPRFCKQFQNGELVLIDSPKLPFISFRMQEENDILIEKIAKLIHDYKGAFLWQLYAHDRHPLTGKKWTIEPMVLNIKGSNRD